MLSEEKRKIEEIIKDIKIYIYDYINESIDENGYTQYEIGEEEQEFFNKINTVLDFMTKLQKENEELNKKVYLCTPEIPQCEHGKYVSYSDLIDKIILKDKEIKEKDKQIDLMAEELTTPINSKEWVREYYSKLAKEKGK